MIKNRLLLTTWLITVMILSACSPSRERMEKKIIAEEKRLFDSEKGFSKAGVDSLVVLYLDFAETYPSDSLAPEYLFKASTMKMNMGNGEDAIRLYEQFMQDYPGHQKAPLCLFFVGYVQENVLGNLGKAKEVYLEFIGKYPDHDFADDARIAIENLGKTPEQMIREFEEKHKADSLAEKH